MTFAEYQESAKRTLNAESDITMPALGLAGEVGEVVELVKKFKFHQKGLDVTEIVGELGDVLWYVSALASQLGVSLETVARGNIEKLTVRYPTGFVPGGGNRG